MKKRLQRILGCVMLCVILMSSVTVSASAAGFEDVPGNHWAAPSIQRCVELKFFQGETAERFGLGHSMTRSAFAVVLCRFFGWETPVPTESTYTDVPVTAWYAGAVEAAVAHGALTRQTETFRPADPITREELAVMLVRALGYGPIAGLAQDLSVPFRDIKTNTGYIAMAYDLGLVSGTTEESFSPDKTATREQVAVILMRLYDKIRAEAPGKTGIAEGMEALCNLEGFEAVAVAAGQLMNTGGPVIRNTMGPEETVQLRDAIRNAGVKALLYVKGGPTALNGNLAETAKVVAQAVENGEYDGVFLDIPELKRTKQKSMTNLVKELDKKLGEKLLFVMAEAPAWHGKNYEGYDYKALAAQADRLVVRVNAYEGTAGQIPVAPVDPIEEVYYALRTLQDNVDDGKLSLMLHVAGDSWKGGKRQVNPVSGAQIQDLLALPEACVYDSQRYANSYLITSMESKNFLTVWYLGEQDVEQRVQLAGCFGVDQLCLNSMQGCTEDLLNALS